jgi:hypothetical protein
LYGIVRLCGECGPAAENRQALDAAPRLGVRAAEVRRAKVLDRLPAQRSGFVGWAASCRSGDVQRALKTPLTGSVELPFDLSSGTPNSRF